MPFSCDRTGFPLVWVEEAGLEVHLLPVTKVQFERFMADCNTEFGDRWYDEVLALDPKVARVSHRFFTEENREGLFLTGILPEEALSFARWMGGGYDIPTVEEWRTIYAALGRKAITGLSFASLRRQPGTQTAGLLLERLAAQLRPRLPLDLLLLRGGVVEWVRDGKRWTGLGLPRQEFFPVLREPLAETIDPILPLERRTCCFFGLRLVRRPER